MWKAAQVVQQLQLKAEMALHKRTSPLSQPRQQGMQQEIKKQEARDERDETSYKVAVTQTWTC